MALFSPQELFDNLPPGKFAIGAFNVHDMEYTQAVIKAAEAEKSPVILMIGEPMISFAGLDMLANICLFAARNCNVPVAVTLDHGKSMTNIDKCIELGISVMFDGSCLPFEENLKLTKEIVSKAHHAGLSVEGELGSIGGSEDGETVSSEKMTDPIVAAEFVKQTGVDILAISIGNCHGLYRGTPRLDIERLKKIMALVNVPLVLHGGSDLPVDLSNQAINEGIKKFNVGTDLKYAFCNSLKQTLNQNPMPFQPPEVLGPAREAVFEVTRQKIRLFGSSGLALKFNKC
jgi:fructose-bisphosphate aldolase, class II